jgi:hypothetical protein
MAIQESAGFTQKDAENLERVKDAMAELAVGKEGLLSGKPDTAAAMAFAHLLDAETRRQEITLKSVEKATEQSRSVEPPPLNVETGPWSERVASEAARPAAVAAA